MRFIRHHIHSQFLLLLALELAVFLAAPFAGALIRFGGSIQEVRLYVGPLRFLAVPFASLMWLGMLAMGLYSPRQRERSVGIALRVLMAAIGAFALCAVLFYALPSMFVGRGVLGLAAVISAIAAITLHVVFERYYAEDLFRRRVLVYGSGRRAVSIRQLRRRSDQRGFHIVGFVRCDGDETVAVTDRMIDMDQDLYTYARANRIDEIVVAMDDRRRAFPGRQLLQCKLHGIEVVDLVDFLERETGRLCLDVINPGWMIFSGGFRGGPIYETVTRIFDVCVSMLLLLVVWPFIVAIAVAIKVEDGWRAPLFYSQLRVGLYGVPFRVYKLRSMRIDAERDGEAQWAVKNDARVTRVGGFARKTRIDELPQIFNVLRGDMSFVGPRPERPEFVAQLEPRIPYYSERHTVKPGVTGWAQLCFPYGSSEKDAAEKLQYDLFYVKNRSVVFDLMILVQTVEVILLGKGAR